MILSAGLTNGLVFFIVFGATLFSYVFRALGGEDVVIELLKAMGIDTAASNAGGGHHGFRNVAEAVDCSDG